MRFPRSAGILLHISSLSGHFGIGDLGPSAYRFLEFLEQAGQTVWQLLPLGPPSEGNSPYSCYSAFAGNPLFISPISLVENGMLGESHIQPLGGDDTGDVDFDMAYKRRLPLLRASFEHFRLHGDNGLHAQFKQFVADSKWLDDFALYTSLSEHFGNSDWTTWGPALVQRDAQVLHQWRDELKEQIEFTKYLQFAFRLQYDQLKKAANQRRIRLFGDMPIFVAHASADVWAKRETFLLDGAGKPTVVAGVPPDYFSETGQLWGNPLYDWDQLRETGYEWWIERFRAAFHDYDLLRLDHFRGFETYWEIPAGSETAVNGHWADGPRDELFTSAAAVLGDLPIVAEDLGRITDGVHALRDRLGFPGMRVMQFGFEREDDPFHRPDHFPMNSVAYTGTHDNDTMMSWYADRRANRSEDPVLDRYLSEDRQDVCWDLIRMVLRSAANLAIVPLQDILGLGSEARMNVPGQATGNWVWRCPADVLTDELAQGLCDMTTTAQRLRS
ncbi:MAG: 4-alpha-glucanotransferase [Pirellulaceae bacterium]